MDVWISLDILFRDESAIIIYCTAVLELLSMTIISNDPNL
jgi:hypothetical protein